MQVYPGVDLAEWYAAGRWVALLELIDGLPAASRYNDAVANDPDLAEELAKLPEPDEPWAPRLAEFDLNAVQNAELIDLLKALLHVTIAANSKSPPQPDKPAARPRTAVLIAKQNADRDWAVDFIAQFGFDADDI